MEIKRSFVRRPLVTMPVVAIVATLAALIIASCATTSVTRGPLSQLPKSAPDQSPESHSAPAQSFESYSAPMSHSAFLFESEISFIKGVDVSFLQQIEEHGGTYYENGDPKDALQILKNHGVNFVRLRVWHTPASGYNDLAHTLTMAKRVKSLGMGLLIDLHYSDTWADPGHQTKPAAWAGLSFDKLEQTVYDYSREVITALDCQDTPPDIVQIGNEITSGFLWDDGRVGGAFEDNWPRFAALLKAAISGVKDAVGSNCNGLQTGERPQGIGERDVDRVSGASASDIRASGAGERASSRVSGAGTSDIRAKGAGERAIGPVPGAGAPSAKSLGMETAGAATHKAGGVPDSAQVAIMLHIDAGGNNATCRWFLDNTLGQKVPFDLIGVSYYPWWHGSLRDLEYNINELARRYGKRIVVVETAYPWTLDWCDKMANLVGEKGQLLPDYPATVEGQRDFLKKEKSIIENIPGSRGAGFFYWEPEYISVPGVESVWENVTLFDFHGRILKSSEAFQDSVSNSFFPDTEKQK